MEIVEIKCSGCGMMRKWRGYECLTFCDCLADKPEDDSNLLDAQVRQKTADIGIVEQPEKPEDMPKTITVLTQDFIQLIMIAGSLCHPEAKLIYKRRMEGDIRKIALRHHINYVG